MPFYSPSIQYYAEVIMLMIKIREGSLFYSEFFIFGILDPDDLMFTASSLQSNFTHYFVINKLIHLNHLCNLFLHYSSLVHHTPYLRISMLIF
jgi:hypothetical protein